MMHTHESTGKKNLDAYTQTLCSHGMSIIGRFLRTKRRGELGDMIIFAIIVVAVLAFFGFITLNFHIF
jgi:hypothetical protein